MPAPLKISNRLHCALYIKTATLFTLLRLGKVGKETQLKVDNLMKDLTKTTPRSCGEMMLGIVQLARVIDKAKAVTHGNIGEYKYDCPMDQSLFEYLGIEPKAFLAIVNNAKSDYEIEAYAKTFIAKKDPRSIEAFNKKFLSAVPTGESLNAFRRVA